MRVDIINIQANVVGREERLGESNLNWREGSYREPEFSSQHTTMDTGMQMKYLNKTTLDLETIEYFV